MWSTEGNMTQQDSARHAWAVFLTAHAVLVEVVEVRLAKQRLAPARVGYGTGVSYINVNRNIIDPKTRRWWEGPNYEGPSDKTVAVIASGGLSHFVIDEAFDREVIRALEQNDSSTLSKIPEPMFQAGTSEIKNWIVVAGAMSGRRSR